MRLSGFMFLTDLTIGPAELARALEDRGFSGLWVPEHPHIPTARRTPTPELYGGGDLAPMYQRLLDPFVALTAAALATSRLRVGTGICLLALRDAVVTAKEIATLDLLSGGRFDFGVGYGWNADEFPGHGSRFDERRSVVADKVALMRALWRDDVAEHSGEHVSLEPSWAWPKPVQRPGPPVWLGGNGPRTMEAAARWADHWYPTPSPRIPEQVATFARLVEQAGRTGSVGVGVAAASGDADELRTFAECGIEEVSVALPSAGRDEVLAHLDQLAVMIDVVRA